MKRDEKSEHLPGESAAGLLEREPEVLRAIRDTAFGTIEVVVHQSRVVQITRSERVRFDAC